MGFSERTFERGPKWSGSRFRRHASRLNVCSVSPKAEVQVALTPSQQGSNGYRIAASVRCTSKNALGAEKGCKLQDNEKSFTPRPSERICDQSWWP
jgi:hypothetical protein